jgi:glycosyltransferase involved in cell wall biosynthesis
MMKLACRVLDLEAVTGVDAQRPANQLFCRPGPTTMREISRNSGGFAPPAAAERHTQARPQLLFVSCHLPWPAISGGRRRELELIKRIAERFSVYLLVISKTPARDLGHASVLRRYCRHVEVFAAAGAEQRVLDPADPPKVWLHRCPSASRRIAEILANGDADLIHVEGFYLMQHIPTWAWTPLLLVEQNVEYELERQRAVTIGDVGVPPRLICTQTAEHDCWRRATQVAAVTAEDAETIERALTLSQTRTIPDHGEYLLNPKVSVVPDGADHLPGLRAEKSRLDRECPGEPLLMMLAYFGYEPNVDASVYLCREILPRIREQVPAAVLWLVGNAPPPLVQALSGDQVMVTGLVPDVRPYLDAADVVVCPLRIGGGIKVKTLEALRRGKAIVSTTIGAQGLSGTARQALAIADGPEAFARAVIELLLDSSRRAQLERDALRAGAQLPSWDEAADALVALYDQLLEQAPASNVHCAAAAAGGLR